LDSYIIRINTVTVKFGFILQPPKMAIEAKTVEKKDTSSERGSAKGRGCNQSRWW